MKTRTQRTILNWRWWLALPVFAALLPLAVISMLAVAMSDGIAKITGTLMDWTRTT